MRSWLLSFLPNTVVAYLECCVGHVPVNRTAALIRTENPAFRSRTGQNRPILPAESRAIEDGGVRGSDVRPPQKSVTL